MTPSSFIALMPILFALAGIGGDVQPAVTRVIVEHETIMRVPIQARPIAPGFEWIERNGPKCLPTGVIRNALLSDPDHVDFVLLDRSRVRAQFSEDCPGLDFYGGFYLQLQDGQMCAKRDSIHSRMGGSCQIERFSQLVPKLKR